MNYLKLLTISIFVLSIMACDKKSDEGLLPIGNLVLEATVVCEKEVTINEDTYFVFGAYAGECYGPDCIVTYRFGYDGLYEDMNDPYMGNGDFDFNTKLSEGKFELAKCLYADLPSQLLNDSSQTYGCPDCLDAGGLFVQWIEKGVTKTWNIDIIEDNIPSYLHDFIQRMGGTIRAIRE